MVLVPVWYAANGEWLAFLVSRTTSRSVIVKAFYGELAEKNSDGVQGIDVSSALPEIDRLCTEKKSDPQGKLLTF